MMIADITHAAAMGDLEWLLDLVHHMNDDNYPGFDQMEYEYLIDCITTLEAEKEKEEKEKKDKNNVENVCGRLQD